MSKNYASNRSRAGRIVQEIVDYHSHRVSYSELKEAVIELQAHIEESDDDFSFDFDGNEYRIISDSSIWDIYVDEIQQIVEDCYDLKLDEMPSFVAFKVDWERTAENCYADGYGHTFSGYDGSEIEAAGFYIFRTN